MTEIETLINLFEKRFIKSKEYVKKDIEPFLREKIKKNSHHPGSFTYNRVNHGTTYFLPLFEMIKNNTYIYLGPNYPYTGLLLHNPKNSETKEVGTWEHGSLQLKGNLPDRLTQVEIETRLEQIASLSKNQL